MFQPITTQNGSARFAFSFGGSKKRKVNVFQRPRVIRRSQRRARGAGGPDSRFGPGAFSTRLAVAAWSLTGLGFAGRPGDFRRRAGGPAKARRCRVPTVPLSYAMTDDEDSPPGVDESTARGDHGASTSGHHLGDVTESAAYQVRARVTVCRHHTRTIHLVPQISTRPHKSLSKFGTSFPVVDRT